MNETYFHIHKAFFVLKKYRYDKDTGNIYGPKGLMNPSLSGSGYYTVKLCIGYEITVNVHHIVAYHKFGEDAFKNGIVVRHRRVNPDTGVEIRTDNTWDNIDIGTRKNNYDDMPHNINIQNCTRLAKLSEDQVREIKNLLANNRDVNGRIRQGFRKFLAEKFCVSGETISKIDSGARYSWVQ